MRDDERDVQYFFVGSGGGGKIEKIEFEPAARPPPLRPAGSDSIFSIFDL